MIQINNITDEAIQIHTIIFEESEIILILKFLPIVNSWVFDIEYKNTIASGYRLALGTLHMISRNFPFDFVVQDASGLGIDPYMIDDFSTGRCILYMLESADMEGIRGGPVPI